MKKHFSVLVLSFAMLAFALPVFATEEPEDGGDCTKLSESTKETRQVGTNQVQTTQSSTWRCSGGLTITVVNTQTVTASPYSNETANDWQRDQYNTVTGARTGSWEGDGSAPFAEQPWDGWWDAWWWDMNNDASSGGGGDDPRFTDSVNG